MLYSAIVLEEYLQNDEREILDAYFKRAYKKFIHPIASKHAKIEGLWEFWNYRLGVLAYSRWTRNAKLAAKELKRQKSQFSRRIKKSGYVYTNSY